jgi:serine/threonine protein kinase
MDPGDDSLDKPGAGGQPVGHGYRRFEALGTGSMGTVYRAEDLQGRDLAVKILRSELASDPIVVARFIQERSVLLRLSSPHIVRVVDLVVEGETMAIVMERVAGGSLRRNLKQRIGLLGNSESVGMCIDVLDGLAVAHGQGVIHRDVKPDNLLIDESSDTARLKITDFGISGLAEGSAHTRLTSLVGTPEYMAPELVEPIAATPAVDVYSTGIVLYELLAGRTPFGGGNVYAVLKRHAEAQPERPSNIGDDLWKTLQLMLSKQPGYRPSAADAKARLEAIRDRDDTPTVLRSARITQEEPVPPETSAVPPPLGNTPSERTPAPVLTHDDHALSETVLRNTVDSREESPSPPSTRGRSKRKALVIGGVFVTLAAAVIGIAIGAGGFKGHKSGDAVTTNSSKTASNGPKAAAVAPTPYAPGPITVHVGASAQSTGSSQLTSVSCTSATLCMAVDYHGNVLTYNGSIASAPISIDGTHPLNSISCTSPTFCAVLGTGAMTYNGSGWSAPTLIDGTNYLESISCTSDTFCVAVDGKGNALYYDGSSWSAPVSIDDANELDSISCASSTFCAAVDSVGDALTYNGTSWSAPSLVSDTGLNAVACPSVTFCVAVATDTALTYNGSAWSTPTVVYQSTADLYSVSCSSNTFCVAIDGKGNALLYDGSRWLAPTSIDGSQTLISVSCPSEGFCVAVDLAGNIVNYRT